MYRIILVIILLLALGACSVSKTNQGAIANEGHGILKLSGNTANISFTLNGQAVQNTPGMNYELKSGGYELVVSSGGKVVLRRLVLISASLTTVVVVP
ncbi:MAG: hypothetical protein U1B83_00490 [Candidatus Cloacimonadaceae bacterium]|nr:hypothetical protein [Candidatus Cloacimonadaceae bacterium]